MHVIALTPRILMPLLLAHHAVALAVLATIVASSVMLPVIAQWNDSVGTAESPDILVATVKPILYATIATKLAIRLVIALMRLFVALVTSQATRLVVAPKLWRLKMTTATTAISPVTSLVTAPMLSPRNPGVNAVNAVDQHVATATTAERPVTSLVTAPRKPKNPVLVATATTAMSPVTSLVTAPRQRLSKVMPNLILLSIMINLIIFESKIPI